MKSRRLIGLLVNIGQDIVYRTTSTLEEYIRGRCPLWVKSRHVRGKTACPSLFPKADIWSAKDGASLRFNSDVSPPLRSQLAFRVCRGRPPPKVSPRGEYHRAFR